MAGDGSLDQIVMEAVAGHRSDWATGLARGVMWAGTTPAVVAVEALAALIVVVASRAYWPALVAVTSLVSATVTAVVLKAVFGRARPPAEFALVEVGGASFPSTQAAETAALVAAVLVATTWGSAAVHRVVVAGLLASLVLVGGCMVYLGAHWPTDVLAGWVLGGAVGGLVSRLAMHAQKRRSVGAREA